MVSAPQPEAVAAGVDTLQAGGSALDAAISCALVQGVVDPLMCGIGGLGVLQIHDPATGAHKIFEGVAGCPLESRPDMWATDALGETTDGFGYIVKGHVNEAGATAVTAPAVLRMLDQAHRKYGKLAWADLFPEAIRVAEEGWLIRPHVYTVFTQDERKYGRLNYGEKLGLTPDGRRLYLNENGDYRKPGSLIRNPDLARTLGLLAKDGAETMYTGELARHMVDDVRANGGILGLADFETFRPREVSPLEISYRGWRIAVPPPPFGGLLVAEIMRILEAFDMTSMTHNSPEYIKVLSEAMKIAMVDRGLVTGDPDFSDTKFDHLLSVDYIKDRVEQIRRGDRQQVVRKLITDSQHTTHVSVVDKDGMFVSLTHTLGNPSGHIVSRTGFMLNGGMSTYDPVPGNPNSIRPGKRRYSTMSPTLVFDGERPVITIGAPGASWIGPAIVQALVNILDWGMTMQEAISAPRVVSTGNAIDISNRIPHPVQRSLESDGYEVRRTHLSYAFAGVHGIARFGDRLLGGADPQRDGYAGGA
jgi:gamma-glutamyltranspeptidase/glutathione hydrolase